MMYPQHRKCNARNKKSRYYKDNYFRKSLTMKEISSGKIIEKFYTNTTRG
jgi:hypothetical protein